MTHEGKRVAVGRQQLEGMINSPDTSAHITAERRDRPRDGGTERVEEGGGQKKKKKKKKHGRVRAECEETARWRERGADRARLSDGWREGRRTARIFPRNVTKMVASDLNANTSGCTR